MIIFRNWSYLLFQAFSELLFWLGTFRWSQQESAEPSTTHQVPLKDKTKVIANVGIDSSSVESHEVQYSLGYMDM